MKGKQTALMPGNEDKVGYWLTPPDLMAALQYEFDFDFDACPYPRPAGFDGLKEPWGKRTWCNPPFAGTAAAWAHKAVREAGLGKLVVCAFSANRLDTVAPIFLDARPDVEVRLLARVAWRNPDGDGIPHQKTCTALFILTPNSVHAESDEQRARQEGISPPLDEGEDEQT